MSFTTSTRQCRLTKHLQMAKSIDAEARTEEARSHLQECQMKQIEVDYRDFNYFNTELTIVVDSLNKNMKK